MAVYRLEDDSVWFPHPGEAVAEYDGLLAVAGELVGGFYGVSIGRCFFGESMFAHAPNASKCAFATFARQIFAAGTPWIDCQVYTDHLARFGAKEIPRAAYLDLLAGEMSLISGTEECG